MEQASRTAQRVAERRAAHQLFDRPPVFEDPLALRMAGNPRLDDHSRIGRYLRAFLAVRSRVAEDVLARAKVEQYVIVGAGFDTFAYRNQNPNLRVFEVDHPASQAAKRKRLRDAGIDMPENLTFVAADLAVTSLGEALAESGFEEFKPAVFAWLGVVPYLEVPAIEATLRDVASFGGGAEIVFDYGLPRKSLPFLARLVFDRMATRVAAAGEPWRSFFTPPEIDKLLREAGFTQIDDLGGAELNARYFAGRTDGLRVGEAGRIIHARTSPIV